MLKVSEKRIKFDESGLSDIKEAITKADIAKLVSSGTISVIPVKGVSRGRARKAAAQRRKGRRSGHGSRKGKKKARTPKKEQWMNRIRALREVLAALKEKKKISNTAYWNLYRKAKGGFFRSKRHLKLYIQEQQDGTVKNEK